MLLIVFTYIAVSVGLLAATSMQSPAKLPVGLGVVVMFGVLIAVLYATAL
jgi:hypothetical protein